jgi:outer membrane protein assembly factor BamB
MVGDHEGYVHAMDIADGRFIARTRVTSKDIKVEPFVNDGRIYILTRKGVLAALSIERLPDAKS